MWMKTKTSIIKQQLLALKKKQLCTLTFFKLLKFRFNTFFLHIPGWFEPIFLVKYIFLFCEGLEEDLTCLETRTIFLCDLHLAYILQDQVLQRNNSKSLLFCTTFLFYCKALRKRSMSDAHEINDVENQCILADSVPSNWLIHQWIMLVLYVVEQVVEANIFLALYYVYNMYSTNTKAC